MPDTGSRRDPGVETPDPDQVDVLAAGRWAVPEVRWDEQTVCIFSRRLASCTASLGETGARRIVGVVRVAS